MCHHSHDHNDIFLYNWKNSYHLITWAVHCLLLLKEVFHKSKMQGIILKIIWDQETRIRA